MVPIYIFYSMFGFQRTGDAMWAAADQMARGFYLGATAGRTTLTGEGLQHADGHSPLLASTNPAIVSYDPAYVYEIGHIVRDGLRRMYGEGGPDGKGEDVMYYVTLYNEPYLQPAEPEELDVEGVLKGMYLAHPGQGDGPRVQLLASGVAVPWALEAQQLLRDDWGVVADVWSVTSWSELRRDGLAADAEAFNSLGSERRVPYIAQRLADAPGPVVAVSDYMRAVPDQVGQFVPGEHGRFVSLGADGFGFSDTRAAARRFFQIDGPSVAVQALASLGRSGEIDGDLARQAYDKYALTDVTAGTTGNAGGES
jgi:pyruvate dehydrogenase E1 component